MYKKLPELLRNASPVDLNWGNFDNFCDNGVDSDDPYSWLECLLAARDEIDWAAYLANYPDVQMSGINPVSHFVRNGIFEGRKLYSKCRDAGTTVLCNQPKVSVVVACYNNAPYLPRCIDSLLGQTMGDIEIIIVDDASTDNSAQIIESYTSRFDNVKAIIKDRNQGTLDTRRQGVKSATGKYLMFIDSDDYYRQDACEIAYNTIIKGYDIVKFGVGIINFNNANSDTIEHMKRRLNHFDHKIYFGSEISNALFFQREVDWMLWSKIFVRELCVKAYDLVEPAYLLGGEDVLALASITKRARSMYCISDKLYNWNYGSGVSTTRDASTIMRNILITANAANKICAWGQANNFDVNPAEINDIYCTGAINSLLMHGEPDSVERAFRDLVDLFGLRVFIGAIVRHYAHRKDYLLTRYVHVQPVCKAHSRRIGVVYFSDMRINEPFPSLYNATEAAECKVSILERENCRIRTQLPSGVATIIFPDEPHEQAEIKDWLLGVAYILKRENFDTLVAPTLHSLFSTMESLLYNLLNIRAVCICYENAIEFLNAIKKDTTILGRLKCCDMVLCLHRETAVFLRGNGIRAESWHDAHPSLFLEDTRALTLTEVLDLLHFQPIQTPILSSDYIKLTRTLAESTYA